jgi:Icc-related predicted phosphoesterase
MKLQIVSDLHLEFNKYIEINNAGADILLLAGDICLAEHLYRNPRYITKEDGTVVDTKGMPNNGFYAKDAENYLRFFEHVSNQFDTVLYIVGNHEHYSGRWNDTVARLRTALEPYSNIFIMDDTWMNINGIRFIGTSLWTDLNKADPLTVVSMKDMMNDYKAITINNSGVYHKLRPIDTVEAHYRAVEFIKQGLKDYNGPAVVLGHHAPSRNSIHPRYQNQGMMNHAFYTSLDHIMVDHPNIKLWIHGHVHDAFDYMIGQTRVICNPHGYPGEYTAGVGFDPNLIIEI